MADSGEDPLRIRGIDVHEYLVKDIDRARRFYSEVLGLQGVEGSQNEFEFELPDGSIFAIYQPREGDELSGRWQPSHGIFFAVDDAGAAAEHLRAQGTTVSQPLETSVCFIVFARDTEGNEFIIHQRKQTRPVPAA
jgi:predicted enzyme related to lactoylglutathione lyase